MKIKETEDKIMTLDTDKLLSLSGETADRM